MIVLQENLQDDPEVLAQYDKGPFGSVDRDGFDFTAISIRTCDGTPRQRWQVYMHPRTGRKLVINERSGLCLDVPSGSTTSGRDLGQFPWTSSRPLTGAPGTTAAGPTCRTSAARRRRRW